MGKFDDHKAEEDKKIKEKQEQILQYLENISKACGMKGGGNTQAHMTDVADELDFKSKELANSETTQNRLEGELNKRQGELEKIESLDLKISDELKQVELKQQQYETEIASKFDLIDEMRATGQAKIQDLSARKKKMESSKSVFDQQLGYLKLKHASKQQQLADDEVASNLTGLESKIRQFGQTLCALDGFIKQRSSETNFEGELNACLDISQALNKMLLERRPQMA